MQCFEEVKPEGLEKVKLNHSGAFGGMYLAGTLLSSVYHYASVIS